MNWQRSLFLLKKEGGRPEKKLNGKKERGNDKEGSKEMKRNGKKENGEEEERRTKNERYTKEHRKERIKENQFLNHALDSFVIQGSFLRVIPVPSK